VGGPDNCPYVGPQAVAGNDAGPQSCMFLAERAFEAATMATNGPDANQAIDTSFGGADNLALFRAWYANGANNTMNLTTVMLAGTLRQSAVCDNNPTPSQSAFNVGVALGKKLYIQAMNERLKEVGIDFDYPNGSKPSKSIRYCQKNLREPALQDAEARLSSALAQEPLCSAIGGDAIEHSTYLAQYKAVEQDYLAGAKKGIKQEDTKAQNILMGNGCCIASPLVLDLGGDGIHLGGSARFDLVGNGGKVESAWVQGDDALLVRDVNGNGRIDDVNELFGNNDTHANGFAALAAYDDNNDGVIDSRDAAYTELQLWQDADGDGVSTPDELSGLSQMGVKGIELSYTESARVDRHGNQLRQTARFLRTAEFAEALGATGTVVDVWFNYR
jgi:hypothetical protein